MDETTTALVQWVSIVVLACFSALFSGLTLGLLSLDKIGLKIVMSGGDEDLAALASTIAPVRENGNLLLCTLLLGNVAVNAYLSILMAEITSGIAGFLISTAVIVIFGEIIPQASCSRYALQIGAKAIPIVKVLILMMYPITYPMSLLLDYVLGDELGTIHTRTELTELLRIHVQHGAMDVEQGQISEGAITYVDKKVSGVMSPFDDSFLLSASDQLNFKKITEIFKSGYSRIPVYEKDKHDIIGILLVKDLIFVDPDDSTPVRNFIQIFGRNFHLLWPDDTLGDVLRIFKEGKSHMAIVRDVNNTGDGDPFYEMKGIVTLEDIIEEILQDEIHDETDNIQLSPDGDVGFDYSKLRLLDSGKLEYEKLTDAEALAIGAHFAKNVKAFSSLNYDATNTSTVITRKEKLRSQSIDIINGGKDFNDGQPVFVDGQDMSSTAQSPASGTIELGAISIENTAAKSELDIKKDVMELLLDSCPVIDQARIAPEDEGPAPQDFFYRKGVEADYMIMVLTGKVTVLAGRDGFRSEAGPWSVLGADSLKVDAEYNNSGSTKSEVSTIESAYVPDFHAYVNSPEVRYIKISRRDYKKALSGEYVWKISAPMKGLVFKSNVIQNDNETDNDPSSLGTRARLQSMGTQMTPRSSLEPTSTSSIKLMSSSRTTTVQEESNSPINNDGNDGKLDQNRISIGESTSLLTSDDD